ncbi:MAG: excinuclease ABC subunit UvrB [Chlamydiales bacterium]|nr:excinuclease ABC subunit UvrB [Chlamydiales bacterium]
MAHNKFILKLPFPPAGDQPQAIDALTKGVLSSKKAQVLLGITGSGKTFTIANVIANVQKPTLILAHNKTLAAQLYQEFKAFFPENAVEYFVSYYDYYQPEAYIPRTDTYIEKDMSINDQIDRMRLSATRSLIERDDVIIVASVSCIYGLGMPEYYAKMNLTLKVGEKRRRDDLLIHLVEMRYERNDYDFHRGVFRARGDVLDIFPAYEEAMAYRIYFFGDDIEKISIIDPLTGKVIETRQSITLYPGSHFVTPEEVRFTAINTIRAELKERVAFFEKEGKLIEKQRIQERTLYDLEMMRETGVCKGIENYSRHFGQRKEGSASPCLWDYFSKDFLLVVDESHQTVPQLNAMYNGDRARKTSLIDFGFRLPSAYDNRPLKFEEIYQKISQVIYVSATPSKWEINEAEGLLIEQIIRPTGLLDPEIEIRPATTEVDDCLEEIRVHTSKKGRVLLTTLTKRLAEDLTKYLLDLGVKAKYLHSDIDTLERMQIIRDLRLGTFDVLVGINLLREGLDIPEVSLVAILDADKEGFLRSETALIQTCGRAARNSEGRVIMYADKMTEAIKNTLAITKKRRELQNAYNKAHGIEPKTIKRDLGFQFVEDDLAILEKEKKGKGKSVSYKPMSQEELRQKISECEKDMKLAAKEWRFEDAARLRDLLKHYQELEMI